MKKFIERIIFVMRRKRYYYVTFSNSNTGLGNITMAGDHDFDIRNTEDYIGGALGGGRTVILSYKRISRKEYEKCVGYDNRKKNQ